MLFAKYQLKGIDLAWEKAFSETWTAFKLLTSPHNFPFSYTKKFQMIEMKDRLWEKWN